MSKLIPVFKILSSKQKKNFFILIFLTFITLCLEIGGIGMFIPLMYSLIDNVDQIRNNFFFKIFFDEKDDVNKIFLISAFTMCGFLIIKNFYLMVFHYFEGRFIHGARETISHRLFKKFIENEYNFFIQKHTSKMLTRIKSDLDLLTGALTSTSIIFTEIVMIVGISLIIFFYDPKSFLIVSSTLIFFTLIYFLLVTKKIASLREFRQKFEEGRFKNLQEAFGGIKEIKIFKKENFFLNNYLFFSKSISKIFVIYFIIQRFAKIYFELVLVIGLVFLLIYFKSESSIQSKDFFASISVFLFAALRLIPSLSRLILAFNSIKFSKRAVENIDEELSNQTYQITDHKIDYPQVFEDLKIENLSITYENRNQPTIENFNYKIKKGQKILIVGETGSGKSTLADIITGIKKGDVGKIYINQNIEVSNIFPYVSYVPQNVFLFDDTILNNITFNEENFDQEKLNKSIKVASLENFINSLPNKLKTIIGEKGSQISGGQAQRMGIARALYHDKPIIVFDEATSALDNVTETKLIKNLFNYYNKKTFIMIAHKFKDYENFDTVIQMSKSNLKFLKNH
jgi:ABC-type multidrug transport system fused ATPase/permease subunit